MSNILDKGFVNLIDHMGSDEDIVRAARVSYDNFEIPEQNPDKNRGLIRYLMRHGHTSPFEMAEIKLHIKAPIQVARQWLRYRTANVNEMSGRYVEFEEDYYLPDNKRLNFQSQNNKQGTSDEFIDPHLQLIWQSRMHQSLAGSFVDYREEITDGQAKENARGLLPLNTYTSFIWKNDLHNTLHFLHQRLDKHAQWEIRQYAKEIEKIIADKFPLTYEAWVSYVKDAVTFSREEMELVRMYMNCRESYGPTYVHDDTVGKGMSNREWNEFKEKLDG